MRTAHIVTADYEVGDKVLAICGKEHKVKTRWADIPADNPICRDCVDTALVALTEVDAVVTHARRWTRRLVMEVTALTETLNPDDGLDLDEIADANDAYEIERMKKRAAKAEKQKAKRTCTCEWAEEMIEVINPDCPIHGGSVAASETGLPPVAPELPGQEG